jgi:hypothetical protein
LIVRDGDCGQDANYRHYYHQFLTNIGVLPPLIGFFGLSFLAGFRMYSFISIIVNCLSLISLFFSSCRERD